MKNHALTEFRKYLHRYPELSGEETGTANLIKNELTSTSPTRLIENIGGSSIIAEYAFQEEGPTVLFRCELDALPIKEQNNFKHRSQANEISHKCGHDGHMSIMLGIAKNMHERPLPAGKVLLLFQSAEETGNGARQVVDYLRNETIHIDYVFALHNLPGLEINSIACKKGIFSPEVISVDIKLIGKVSHAAEPEKGICPALAIAEIIKCFHDMNNPDLASDNFFLITPVEVKMGDTAYGVSAGEGVLRYTLRAWSRETLNSNRSLLENTLAKIIRKTRGLKHSIKWHQEFRSNVNNVIAVDLIKKATHSCGLNFKDMDQPLSFGEDFGFLTSKYPGAMFCLGAGIDCKPLHDPLYDFPDEIISTGLKVFNEVLKSIIDLDRTN